MNKFILVLTMMLISFCATAQNENKLPTSVEVSYYSINLNKETASPFVYVANPNNGLEFGFGMKLKSTDNPGSYFATGYWQGLSVGDKWVFGAGPSGAAYGTIDDFKYNVSWETGLMANLFYFGDKVNWLNYVRGGYGNFLVDGEIVDKGITLYAQTGLQFKVGKNLLLGAYSSLYTNGGLINITGVSAAFMIE